MCSLTILHTVTNGYKSRFGEGKNILNHAKFEGFECQEHQTKNWSLEVIGSKYNALSKGNIESFKPRIHQKQFSVQE